MGLGADGFGATLFASVLAVVNNVCKDMQQTTSRRDFQMSFAGASGVNQTGSTIKSEISREFYFRETSHMRSFAKSNPRKMTKSLCRQVI